MKKHHQEVSMLYLLFSMTFTMCLVAANLFATKQISWGIVNFTGAIFVFPVSYIINDVVAEVWGFKRMRSLIWTAFAINFAFVLIGTLVDAVPGADWWQSTDAGKGFHAIFGLAPRIVIASFLAFLVGSFVNAAVMSKMKVASNGKRFTVRAIVSTLLGELCDSIIFFPIALAGIVPLSQMPYFVVCQVTLKTTYEIIILPLTTQIVKRVKKSEGVDVYDHNITYNIFRDKQ